MLNILTFINCGFGRDCQCRHDYGSRNSIPITWDFVNTKHCRCEREGEEETSNGKMGKLLFVWNGQKIKAALGKAVKAKMGEGGILMTLLFCFLLCGVKRMRQVKNSTWTMPLTQYRRHRLVSHTCHLDSRSTITIHNAAKNIRHWIRKWIRYRF